MKKDFVLKGVVLPVVLAAVTGALLFLNLNNNAAKAFPVADGQSLAAYDELKPDETVNDALAPNVFMGKLISEGELDLRYEADYSNLLSCASVCKGSAEFGRTGCIYIKLNTNNVSQISTSEPLTITDSKGEYTYEFVGEKLVSNETEALSLAPPYENSVVVFYRVTKGLGLTDDYYALTYKGVS